MAYLNGKKIMSCDAVYGYSNGYSKGVIDGEKSEQDRFWDKLLKNIKGSGSTNAFAGYGWSDDIYHPNGTIHCGWSSNSMYASSNITDTKVPLDITEIVGNSVQMFANSKIHTVRKLIVAETTGLSNTFNNATNLSNINIEGQIGTNANFGDCTKLTADSILAIVRVLSETVTGKTLTLSLQAVNKAYETTEGANDGSTSETWLGMAQGRSNWTITLK